MPYILGITRDTTAAHLARVTLEGIAFQIADLIGAMRGDKGTTIGELRVDGGASRSEPLMKFQADILGVPVVRPSIVETTALGAAYLAGLAVGFWESPASIASQRKVERVFEPHMLPGQAAELRACWKRCRGAREGLGEGRVPHRAKGAVKLTDGSSSL